MQVDGRERNLLGALTASDGRLFFVLIPFFTRKLNVPEKKLQVRKVLTLSALSFSYFIGFAQVNWLVL